MTTERKAQHATITVERTYPASPERVFQAWADPRAKARWFSGPPGAWTEVERTMDFRVGGRDRAKGRLTSGVHTVFDSVYFEIVPNERIVYAYEMHLDERRISVSLATIEIRPQGNGTRLVVTEQGVFLDGYDDSGSREQGTNFLMDQLGKSLET